MQSSRKLRLCACLAPPLAALGFAVLASCEDMTRPGVVRDDWAEGALAAIQMRQDLTVYRDGKPWHSATNSIRTQLVPYPGMTKSAAASFNNGSSDANREHRGRRIAHFQARDGKVFSIAAIFDGQSGSPPTRLYAFENGMIKAIVSPTYEKRGGSAFRMRSRVTLFDEHGNPVMQLDSRPDAVGQVDRHGRGRKALRAVSDATAAIATALLPSVARADDVSSCLKEWLDYGTKSGLVAVALAELTTAVAVCLDGVAASCNLVDKLTVALAGAISIWNDALEKLAACREKQGTRGTNAYWGNGGSNTYTGGTINWSSLETSVNDFINKSIANGSYSCTPSGDYCVYYSNTV